MSVKVQRRLLLFIVFFSVTLCVSAQTGFTADLDVGAAGDFSIPTASYLKTLGSGESAIQLPAVRPQARFGLDLNPAGLYIDNFRFTLGFSGFYTTDSAVYASTYLRGFLALGVNLKLSLDFSNHWSAWARGRFLMGRYRPFNSYFLVADAELAASYRIVDGKNVSFAVSLPVGVSFRSDMIVPRAGLVLSLGFRNREWV